MLISSTGVMIGWIAVFFTPAGIVIALVLHARREYCAEAKEPFTDLPLRPPGESTRLAAERHFERAMESLLTCVAACGLFGCGVAMTPAGHRMPLAVVAGIAVVIVAAVAGPRVLRRLREYWNCQLGFKGERVVAEELNRLLSSGFHVFHDVPFEGFNIDHVVVGSTGVFAIETKTRRKKNSTSGQPAHMVRYDGRQLTWPSGMRDRLGLEQAERNARTLADWLTKATGERVDCSGILTIPGWWIQRTSAVKPTIAVVATKALERALPSLGSARLRPEQVRRIAFQLGERCRLGT